MAAALDKELVELLSDGGVTKVLATLDEDGFPHAVVKESLQVGEDGNLLYLEHLESSRTNRNLVRSIWFNHNVAIAVQGGAGRSYQIKGRPVKAHIAGPLFRQHYQSIREKLGDVDLAAVWIIEPLEVINESFSRRRTEEEQKYPYLNHLDRLVKIAPH